MTGEIFDYEILPDGTRKLVNHGYNLVVNDAYIALAAVMADPTTYSGFAYWAIGDGDGTGAAGSAAWDAGVQGGSIVPSLADTQLGNEIFRKAITPSDIVFLDGSGNVSASPTNVLEIRVVFNNDEPSAGPDAYLREFGLFAGDATGTVNSGIMVNRKVTQTYVKTSSASLERVLRFTF